MSFLRPTRNKLIFLIEWLLFFLITALQGGISSRQQALVVAYPLLFFYLVAALLESLSRKIKQIARGGWLLALAAGLALLDQAIKLWVTATIPFRTAVPLITGWLNLAHNCNFHGSWILSQFNRPMTSLIPLGIMAFLLLIFSWFGYRYYIAHQRSSLWADVAFLGFFAGLGSWLVEMPLRGHIVDFICLPHVVSADFKDIYLTIGIAAIFVETLDNPGLSRPWQGWTQERANFRQLLRDFFAFSRQEMKTAWGKRSKKSDAGS
ncbi:MAG: signal peptidase II [Ardenticatenaceae bacterium]|nr:signal peptidase II [Ardenticatenaceae bacterium]MCB9443800.1 signal peptidase II [Ardenticatenaceae bacterium]